MIAEAFRSSRSSSCLRKVALVWTAGVLVRGYIDHVVDLVHDVLGHQPYLPYVTISLLRYSVSGNHLSTFGALFQDAMSWPMALEDHIDDTMNSMHSVADIEVRATFLSIVASADEYVVNSTDHPSNDI